MKSPIASFAAGFIACAVLVVFGFTLTDESPITETMVRDAAGLVGLEFTPAEVDSMLEGLGERRSSYERLRTLELPNEIPPALVFNPIPVGFEFEKEHKVPVFATVDPPPVAHDLEDLAFASVAELGALIRTRAISSEQLTRMYLARLKEYGPRLECVITITEDLAIAQARRADGEIARGRYRGPLHGIPYGAKDLLAVKGYPTTWGAMPYKDQVIDQNATVIAKLEGAGAVLVAKLTMGALAGGEVWSGGLTRKPWDLEQGSSGSSAGSASATSAGLVAFAIGTETWGSIVSPATRCGVTGLRPSYGRVSRTGAMALSWSMDKIGPICRTVEDCAIVFSAIIGPDGKDQTLVDAPFNYDPSVGLGQLHIGYLKADFDSARGSRANTEASLAVLRSLGATLIPIELPRRSTDDLSIILSAEAAAAFDDLTRSNRDDLLVRQIKNAWPNAFREARFIPAVEYLQANRVRYQLVQDMERLMKGIDVYVAPSFGGDNLLLTNLTGHPCVVLPNGFSDRGTPTSITFVGRLFGEANVLAAAKAYQEATDHHRKHPPAFVASR